MAKRPTHQQSAKQPRRRRLAVEIGSNTLLCLLVFFFFVLVSYPSTTVAKEIEVTSEWTLLQENDTIPAGMHVRMDLTTGEKWVKLIEEDDEPTTTAAASTEVGVNGPVTTVAVQNDEEQSTLVAAHEQLQTAEEESYDYEMMHRTLSKLPPDEQERIGGLPELPAASSTQNDSAVDSAIERNAFEARMKEIWIQRQAELQLFQEEAVADLPSILQNRIERIQTYLRDPRMLLEEMDLEEDDSGETDNRLTDEGDEEESSSSLTHMVTVLQDLEYHLSDLDMARDFHTLGGWPYLVSLLSDEVHVVQSGQEADLSSLQNKKIHVIQAHAAWVMGTAVKNHDEFFDYAVEEIVIGDIVVTPLSLLLQQWSTAVESDDAAVDVVQMKLQKFLYALGALLRGNRQAQRHFVGMGGVEVLRSSLGGGTLYPKLAKRMLALADDIVTDVVLHTDPVEMTIVEAFSDKAWCHAAVKLLAIPSLQETALRTVQTLAPFCPWNGDKDGVQQAIAAVKDHWRSRVDDTDPELLQERMDLIEATLLAVDKA